MNLLRLTLAFSLMLVPATAMGLSLPLVAEALGGFDVNFGRVLGRLYGCNTLSAAMAGALGRRALGSSDGLVSGPPPSWPAR